MKIAKRALMFTLVFALSVTIFSVFSPRAAHAVISTFVQVTNDGAHAVPIVEGPTAVIFNGPLLFTSPTVDVSAYRKIRVSFATSFSHGARVVIRNMDGSFPIPLAQVSTSTPGFASTVIEVPGRMISLEGGNLDGTALDSVVVDGR